MNLYYAIITSIWLAVLYAIWAATEAGDPGYGQVAFLIGGLVATWYIRKRKLERPRADDKEIEIPEAEFSVEIPDLGDKYFFSESSYRKIIWVTTIFALIAISLFLEAITTGKNLMLGTISLILGIVAFLVPILLPVEDDFKTLRKRAQKERTKAWHKGTFNQSSEEK
ncbi:MAG: hypothetical protein VYA07_01945 [Candidatus Thermoplasmatota archaeon]|nr:hypothetical protein [Candidatus Thermoplasmatota archaeon]